MTRSKFDWLIGPKAGAREIGETGLLPWLAPWVALALLCLYSWAVNG